MLRSQKMSREPVAENHSERTTTVLVVLCNVDFFKEGTSEDVAGVVLEVLEQLILADIHQLDRHVRLKVGTLYQLIDAAPGGFQMLKLWVVKDLIELLIDQDINAADGLHDLAFFKATTAGVGVVDNRSKSREKAILKVYLLAHFGK